MFKFNNRRFNNFNVILILFKGLITPLSNYLLKVNIGNTVTMREFSSELAIRKRCHRRCSGIFTLRFEQISQITLAFLSLTFNN